MLPFSRRSLFFAGGAALAARTFDKPLYAQTYTLRNELPSKPREMLEAVARTGYSGVELGRAEISRLVPYLKEFRLTAPSGHFEAAAVTGSGLDGAIAEARSAGIRLMVVPYLQKAERTAPGFYERFAGQMNKAGETIQKAGLQLAYHHHSFEFEPVNGMRPFDLLAQRFDPKLVKWELDLFWVKMGGADPVAVLNQLKGRVAAVHLKDAAAGSKTEYWEGAVPRTAFKEVGSGMLDWPAILKACSSAGAGLYIVEQDQCPGSPLDSIAQSYKFLRSVQA